MIASQCSFKQMLNCAITDRMLAEATSFIQVEYGIAELHACWDGFVDTSDHHNQEFKSRKQICAEFAHALADYIEYLGESPLNKVGS